MKIQIVIVLVLVAIVAAENNPIEDVSRIEDHPVLGYHSKIGIPLANEIRKAETEQKSTRIVGGLPASLGQIPFHVGIVIDLISRQQSVCSGALLNTLRVLTAAHCWWNRQEQAWRFTLVTGATTLFTGGTRRVAAGVTLHGDYDPELNINNIAVAISPTAISSSANIGFARLPTGDELNESFAHLIASVSGYGIVRDGATIPTNTVLRYVNQFIITNIECSGSFYPYFIQGRHICSVGGDNFGSPCYGDAGGPLTITRNSTRILVGIMSFGHPDGCEYGYPTVFTRVSSYNDWIRQFL